MLEYEMKYPNPRLKFLGPEDGISQNPFPFESIDLDLY
jgi:hypothetical protein